MGFINWLRVQLGNAPRNELADILREELAIQRNENHLLIQHIIELTKPQVQYEPEQKEIDYEKIRPLASWRVRQQMLEEADRKKADLLKEHEDKKTELTKDNSEIDELERQLDIKQKEYEANLSKG